MRVWVEKLKQKRDDLTKLGDDNDLIVLLYYLEIMVRFKTGLPKKSKSFLKQEVLHFYNGEIKRIESEIRHEERVAEMTKSLKENLVEE